MNPFKGRHFQRDIILWAVRWYCKYGISYRELQEMLAERGVNVDHSTIYRWVQRYAPEMEKRLRWYWRNPSDLCPWHMDETYVKVNGRWAYLVSALESASFFPKISSSHLKSITSSLDFHYDHSRTC